jgi:hypothetical protein
VDPHCVQHPDEKMTAEGCPIHGPGRKRADCYILGKPGLVELSGDPHAERWRNYAAANDKCNIVPPIGTSFKETRGTKAPRKGAPQGASTLSRGGPLGGKHPFEGWPPRGQTPFRGVAP